MGCVFCKRNMWQNCISGKQGKEWWPNFVNMFFLKFRLFFPLLQSCHDNPRQLNLPRTKWFIKTRAKWRQWAHWNHSPGHYQGGDMIGLWRIWLPLKEICYQQEVLTTLNVTNFTAIVLAGTTATQWSKLKNYESVKQFTQLKTSDDADSALGGSAKNPIWSFSRFSFPGLSQPWHPEVHALNEVVNSSSSLRS